MLWVSSCSFLVKGFSGDLPGRHRVRSGSLGSVRCDVGVVIFGQGHWVQWGAPWGSSGSFGVSGVRPGVGRVRLGSLGLVGCSLGFILSFRSRGDE